MPLKGEVLLPARKVNLSVEDGASCFIDDLMVPQISFHRKLSRNGTSRLRVKSIPFFPFWDLSIFYLISLLYLIS